MSLFDRARIRRSFSRAAATYDQAAALQRMVGETLLESLAYLKQAPRRVLDLGCGTGHFTRELRRRFPRALVVGLDLAEGMLAVAHRRRGWLRRFALIQGDAHRLPFAAGVFDLVFSNLLLQWSGAAEQIFAEVRRVLAPEGLFLFSTFGPETLAELREALGAEEAARRVSPFPPLEWHGDRLLALGFRHPVLEREVLIRAYPSLSALTGELKALGARNALSDRPRAAPGKRWLYRLRERFEAGRDASGRVAVRWEAIRGLAFAPPPHQPPGGRDPTLAYLPADRIPLRRK